MLRRSIEEKKDSETEILLSKQGNDLLLCSRSQVVGFIPWVWWLEFDELPKLWHHFAIQTNNIVLHSSFTITLSMLGLDGRRYSDANIQIHSIMESSEW